MIQMQPNIVALPIVFNRTIVYESLFLYRISAFRSGIHTC